MCCEDCSLFKGLFSFPSAHSFVVNIVLDSEGCLHFPVRTHVL